jgi:hypothetical protein
MQWLASIRGDMAAKVEIIFGKDAEQITRRSAILEEFELWDMHKTTIYLEYATTAKRYIRRILLFTYHPQYFFYASDSKHSIAMDAKLKIAADMAKIERSSREEAYFVWKHQEICKATEAKKSRKATGNITRRERIRKQALENPGKPRAYRGTNKTTSTDPYLLFPKDTTIETECEKCGLRQTDETPAFWVTDPRFYVIRRKAFCNGCGVEARVFEIPVCNTIPWMRSDLAYLKKDPEWIRKEYNHWAKRKGNRAMIFPEVTAWELEMERFECWDHSPDDILLCENEEDYRDYELEELCELDREERMLPPTTFWAM